MKTTITEALAELHTIGKRIEKKQTFVAGFLTRTDGLRDPLEKQGGSVTAIQREQQAITDLRNRHLSIRMAIQQKNHEVRVKVGDAERTIAEWLTWRKEVAPGQIQFLSTIQQNIAGARRTATQRGATTVSAVAVTGGKAEAAPQDILVNIDEQALAALAEGYEETLGTLDGKLSLLNATVLIEIE